MMGNLYSKIEQLMNKKGITLYRLCKDSGVPTGTLYDLKLGKKQGLSQKTSQKIADYFEITVDELYSGQKKEPPVMDGRVFELITICNQLTDENLLKAADYIRYLISTQG